MATTSLTEDDEGKSVVTADGETVGMVTEVRENTAYVDPEPGMFDRIKAKLDWSDSGEDAYPVGADAIEEITDDELRLRRT